MLNAKGCIDQMFAFKNSRISCLAFDTQLEKSEHNGPVCKKLVAGGEIRRVIYRFFQAIETNQWLSGQGESQRAG